MADKEVSIVFKGDAKDVEVAAAAAKRAIEELNGEVVKIGPASSGSNNQAKTSYIALAGTIAATAASVYALYLQNKRLHNMQLQIQRATYKLELAQRKYNQQLQSYNDLLNTIETSQQAVTDLQNKQASQLEENTALIDEVTKLEQEYRKAIDQFGGASIEAREAGLRLNEAKQRLAQSNKDLATTNKELEKAQTDLARSTEDLQNAQEMLELSQENLEIQEENLRQKTDSVNDSQIMLYMTIATTGLTAVAAITQAWTVFSKMNIAGFLGGITNAVKAHSAALGIAATAAASVMFAYMAFNAETPATRAAYSALTAATMSLTIAQIALAAAKAMNITLSTFGLGAIIVGAAIGSFALVYGLASMFGGGGEVSVPNMDSSSMAGINASTSNLYNTSGGNYIGEINVYSDDPDRAGTALVDELNKRGLY